MTIVTSGAQAVEAHPRPRVDVEQATVWGLGRVIAEEHPELWGGSIDLDPAADADTRAAHLAAEICRGDEEPQVALRDGKRFALRLQPLDVEPAERALEPWPNDGAWLVTGGLGEVGLHLAAGMVAQGVRRLVLVSRSGLPPRTEWSTTAADSRDGRRIAAVRALEASGAAVHLLVADVGDAADLERALRGYEDEAWPPIRGVMHAAGVLETALATQTDRRCCNACSRPKLHGARNLDRLLPRRRALRDAVVDQCDAWLGGNGQLRGRQRRTRRARARSSRSWPAGAQHSVRRLDRYRHVSRAPSAAENLRQLNDIGIQGFTPDMGVAVFNALIGRPEAGITVMPIDWAAFTAARRTRDLKLFEDRVEAPVGRGAALSERVRQRHRRVSGASCSSRSCAKRSGACSSSRRRGSNRASRSEPWASTR